MKNDIFYYLNNLYHKKFKYPEDAEVRSLIWPLNRFLSMEKDLLETVAYTTKYIFILGVQYYKLMFRIIPQSFAQRNKYLKSEKDDKELLERYQKYFKVSKKEAKDYLKILFNNYTKKEVHEFVGLEVNK